MVQSPFQKKQQIDIGISGTGFVSIGLCNLIAHNPDFAISRILTRRPLSAFDGQKRAAFITQSIDELISGSDVIVECTGDPLWSSLVVERAFEANCPVLTMNAELQITAGSYFREKGLLHESEGDQPGSTAALDREVRLMGFKPCVYGSQKTYLDPNPSLESMMYWSKRNNQSLENTISFTDGTKVQIESALIANGLGSGILKNGLLGSSHNSTKEGALHLANLVPSYEQAITDYVLNPNGGGEVFVVASHDDEQASSLAYYKQGDKKNYYIERPYHMGHFEILKSITNLFKQKDFSEFNNGSQPRVSVAGFAKHDLAAGTKIKRAIGSMEIKGQAINIQDYPDHIPISLLSDCEIQRPVAKGEMLSLGDIALPETLASKAWAYTRELALAQSNLSVMAEKNTG